MKMKKEIEKNKEMIIDYTMSCDKEEALQMMRVVWKEAKKYEDYCMMEACEQLAKEIKQ